MGRTEPVILPPQTSETPVPEVWGGVEYTRNRVGDEYFDQMELSGHISRPDDLDRVCELGISRLRFGLLWERIEADRSWKWADERLHQMQQLGLAAIAGLMHHGSGPPHTSLVDPAFPQKLAAHARCVSERYPWIDSYTPVNEPNTTARFSGLYGIWYPHHMDRLSYLRSLLLQVKATVLCMQEIRRVRPDAKLVQTDDLGSIRATSALRDVSDLMNERRWLAFDLLCGTVGRDHPMFEYLLCSGIPARDILWFADHPCPPDILGINYYATSDRFLDHRTWLYPEDRRSAEGNFVDVEAVRVEPLALCGFRKVLLEAWDRYRIPVAITEVHLGSEVAEQIRWAAEAWLGIHDAREQGADCVAMTFWALFGSFYWSCLVTGDNGQYEPGVFDVSSGVPVPTPLADLVHGLASGRGLPDYALRCPAWWRDPARFCFACEEALELVA